MESKTVLVTGATSGIGESVCRLFGQRGYSVLAHFRDESRGDALLYRLRDDNIHVLPVKADLRDEGVAIQLIEQVKSTGLGVTDLVNNAGGVLENNFETGRLENPAASYEVNVFAAYSLSILAAEQLKTESIINLSSVHAHASWGARIPHYSASKAALSHLTKMLAIKLAPHTRVNAVSPGRTKTPAWGNPSPEENVALVNDQLIKRWITVEEVAEAIWFLSQNKACTGTDLLIDGGMSLSPVLANT